MTVEALSPPNLAESLRERLIREGKIIPAADSTSSGAYSPSAKLFMLVSAILQSSERKESETRSIKSHLIKIFRYVNDVLDLEDSKDDLNSKTVLVDYCYALCVKRIKIIISALDDSRKFLSNRVSILRSGFFFAFKENMKNTP